MGVDGSEVWALHVWSGEHFLGLPVSQIVPGKEEQSPDTRICGERQRLRGLEHCSFLKDSLLGAERHMAPHISFPGKSARTPELLLKGNKRTMVRALESSSKSS